MSQLKSALTAAFAAATLAGSLTACRKPDSTTAVYQDPAEQAARLEAVRPAVTAFCGDCHALSPPDSFPHDAWYAEVEQGYRLYFESGRTDLKPPPMKDALYFFQKQAPKTLESLASPTPLTTAGRFRRQSLPAQDSTPAISFLDFHVRGNQRSVWLCDMHSGTVSQADPGGSPIALHEAAHLTNPARMAIADLDSDGRDDLVIADLGSFVPGDHQDGKVWWLSGGAEGGATPSEPRVLMDQVGRVCDVRVADFNADGRLDLLVAEFGWRKAGGIHLLLRKQSAAGELAFERIVIDRRHGTIHLPVCDLNHDGKPDFIAVIAQEHEVVDAFLNLGEGRFERKRIFSAGDPAFGSSGIEVVDMDADGDLDVLYTNGDTLDSHYLKPTHGITWLENRGEFPFHARRLAALPGAMRALAADVDGDADLDIVAVAFLPASLREQLAAGQSETLIWLEQTQPGQFERHSLEIGQSGHMTLLAADLDNDGDIDLAVPNYAEQRTVKLEPLTIWWNERTR